MHTIQQIVEMRRITSLFHFTKVANLDSILKNGLMPPSTCALLGCQTNANDAFRYDGQDAICLSVSFPNHKVFYPFRTRQPTEPWVVLELSTDILHLKRCAFNITNAADATQSGIPLAFRSTPQAFAAMFEDFPGKKRSDLRIADNYPTNPQAEVLCLDTIGTELIKGLDFNDHGPYRQYRDMYAGNPRALERIHWAARYFAPRQDFEHWIKHG